MQIFILEPDYGVTAQLLYRRPDPRNSIGIIQLSFTMFPPYSISLSLVFLLSIGSRADETSSSSEDACDCYLTNGTVPSYFMGHLFFDFRDLGDYADVPDPIANGSLSALAPPTSDYFETDDWTNVWGIQNWTNSNTGGISLAGDATTLLVNSPNNIYIEENSDENAASETYLTMRTRRYPEFQTAAEFESISTYQFLSLRMLARVTGDPGACAAMFTFRPWDGVGHVQEADIEILTGGPRDRIQYTNQPSNDDAGDEVPEATRNASMPGDLIWDNWAVHRLDWTPERSVWYVEGEEVASIEFQTPKDPAQVVFNMWSDGGSWSGNMSVGDEAYLQIQWIEMVFNATEEVWEGSNQGRGSKVGLEDLARRDGDGGCNVVCSIDERDEVGTAKMLWNSTSMATTMMKSGHGGGMAGFVTLMVGVVGWLLFL